jgi:transposase
MATNNGNRALAVDLLSQGLPHLVVAAKLRVSSGTIAHYASWARNQGYSIPYRGKGKPRALISTLPCEVRRWLADQVPPGCSVEDVVRAIVIDTYNEERKA